jgi:hypothetical protein
LIEDLPEAPRLLDILVLMKKTKVPPFIISLHEKATNRLAQDRARGVNKLGEKTLIASV